VEVEVDIISDTISEIVGIVKTGVINAGFDGFAVNAVK
jgi:hypothetical protein